MVGGGAGQGRHALHYLAMLLPLLLFVALAIRFASVQQVWIDESTQLLGSALPLGRMIAWLAGHPEPLGVPADRMPPLGYLIDWSWTRIGGGDPFGFRMLHLGFAAVGLAGTVLLALRRFGAVAALVSGLLLALDPNLVAAAVEIRAYPLFLAATVVQLWLLHGLLMHGLTSRRLAGFVVAGLVAGYVHFFGLVSSGALFCGLLAAGCRSRRDLARIAGAGLVLLLLSAGLAPFVGGARALSNDPAAQGAIGDALTIYLPRVYGHAAMLLSPAATVLLFLGFSALLGAALVRTLLARGAAPWDLALALLVALGAGLVVVVAARLVVHGFDPLKPSYSIWMLPPLALLAGASCAPGGRAVPGLRLLAALTIAALTPATIGFARHGAWFAHGPEADIAAALRGDPHDTALLYLGDDWGYGYFPLVRRYGGALEQYRVDAAGALHSLRDADPANPVIGPAALAGKRELLLIAIEPRSGDDLRGLLGGVPDGLTQAPPEAEIPGWHPTETIIRPGLYWLRMARMERDGA